MSPVRARFARPSPLLIVVLLLANAAYSRWNYSSVAAVNIDFLTLWSVEHTLSSPTFAGKGTPDIYSLDTQRAMGAVLLDEAGTSYATAVQVRATQIAASLY